MALRRTLEMVCKNKGAIGRTLHAKLNDLEEKKILPPLMGGLSKMIKEAGNAAASFGYSYFFSADSYRQGSLGLLEKSYSRQTHT
ncbi:DUF4145 domain-containing protein [Bacillus subtilis]|nr:DUF4145 domain-containing protein [Bacillus subtilis]